MSGEGPPKEEARPRRLHRAFFVSLRAGGQQLVFSFTCTAQQHSTLPDARTAAISSTPAPRAAHCWCFRQTGTPFDHLQCFSASQADPGPLSYLSHLQHSAATLPSPSPHDRYPLSLSLTLREQLPLLCAPPSPLPALSPARLSLSLGARPAALPAGPWIACLAASRPSRHYTTSVWQ